MAILISVQRLLMSSIAVVSVATLLNHHLWLPTISKFLDNELPLIWLSLKSWLTPPYLYLIINGIIITIAASSRYQQHNHKPHHNKMVPHQEEQEQQHEQERQEAWTTTPPPPPSQMTNLNEQDSSPEFFAQSELVSLDASMEERHSLGTGIMLEQYDGTADMMPVPGLDPGMNSKKASSSAATAEEAPSSTAIIEEDGQVDYMDSQHSTTSTMNRVDSMEFTPEKPPVSARFTHRRTVKGTPEAGKVLRVSKPKRHDTLESTWKTITEGRSVPLTRHLKKSDTWQTQNDGQTADDLKKVKKKSESFVRERENQSTPLAVSSRGSVGKTVRREPSLSQDELNRRVEAFIKKFNEEMRLQREESLDQYKELVNKRVGAI